jgi:hypothetical protein
VRAAKESYRALPCAIAHPVAQKRAPGLGHPELGWVHPELGLGFTRRWGFTCRWLGASGFEEAVAALPLLF